MSISQSRQRAFHDNMGYDKAGSTLIPGNFLNSFQRNFRQYHHDTHRSMDNCFVNISDLIQCSCLTLHSIPQCSYMRLGLSMGSNEDNVGLNMGMNEACILWSIPCSRMNIQTIRDKCKAHIHTLLGSSQRNIQHMMEWDQIRCHWYVGWYETFIH